MDTSKGRVTPKDFFLWVATMATLYASVVSFLTLIFNYIDFLFPDPIQNQYVDPYSGGVRFAMASLIVIFPLYIFLTRLLNQDIRKNPEKKDLWVRRWAVFLTLFVGGVTLAIDLVMLINGYLGGELTTRFALKALAVLIVVGGGFLYYLYDIRGRWERHELESKIAGGVAAAIVIASVIGGFFITGSPTSQRLYRADEQKISDLQTIQWQIVNFWQSKESLPASLDEIEDPISGYVVPSDKQTGAPYEYRTLSALSFELCATFNKESRATMGRMESIAHPIGPGVEGESWQHATGRQCFTRTIDPDRYPPIPKGR